MVRDEAVGLLMRRSLALLLVVLLSGCGASGGGTSSAPETTVRIATTTSVVTTTTAPPTTTTTYDLRSETQADIAVIAGIIDKDRITVADGIETDTYIESIDSLLFDEATGTVTLSATSGYPGEAGSPYRRDEAWEVYRTMSQFWAKVDHGWRTALFSPRLAFTNGSESYNCPADYMIRLAEARADRPSWEAECAA